MLVASPLQEQESESESSTEEGPLRRFFVPKIWDVCRIVPREGSIYAKKIQKVISQICYKWISVDNMYNFYIHIDMIIIKLYIYIHNYIFIMTLSYT